jgi:hypothetical protein
LAASIAFLHGVKLMTFTDHPRRLARIAGAFYVTIIVCAIFAYRHVRHELIVPADMAQTASNVVAHERLFRLGFSSALINDLCNLPLGWICYQLLRVVHARLALLALLFITASTAIETVNLLNYITPLFTFTLPEYVSAFDAGERQALARGAMRLYVYGFSVALTFFGMYCLLTGYLIFRSKFLPAILGLMIVAAGVVYVVENFMLFLALPEIPYIGWVTLIAESSLAAWFLIVGVNESKWHARVQAVQGAP